MPIPDEYGRYRVRRKGDGSSPAWSTRCFDPARHVVVSGAASDTYGAALPPKPSRRLDNEPSTPQSPTSPSNQEQES